MTITVRFYAGAAEAAGAPQTVLDLPERATLAELVAALGASNPRLAEVLKVCTLLLDGKPAELTATLPTGQVSVDVLPPFAGG